MSKSYTQVFWQLTPGGHSVFRERSMIHLFRSGGVGAELRGQHTLCGEPIPAHASQTRSKISGGVMCDHCQTRRILRSNPLHHQQVGAWAPTREEIVDAIQAFEALGRKITRLPAMEGKRANEVTCTQFHGAPVGFQDFALE